MNARLTVRRAFSRAAAEYDSAALFQRETGKALLAAVPPDVQPASVADVGCGTGHGLGLLTARWPQARQVAVDFSLAMTRRLSPAVARVCADAEALPLATASIDFFWSNLTLQWCNPVRFAAEAARVLKPGGSLAVSTLGPGTFSELRAAFSDVDDYRHTIDFQAADMLARAFTAAGLQSVQVETRPVLQHHADVGSLLGTIRRLGANRVTGDNRRTGLMGRRVWQRFVTRYEGRRDERGLPLDYETLLIIARKP